MQTEVKLTVVGDISVGKTSILQSFVNNRFNLGVQSTTSASFFRKSTFVDGKQVQFLLYDTAGQERFRSIAAIVYRGSPFVAIVFDVCERSSFESVKSYWYNEIHTKGMKGVQIILIGNKCDRESERQVSSEEIQQYAQSKKILSFEVSAKTGQNIKQLFEEIAKKKFASKNIDDDLNDMITNEASQNNEQTKKKGCC